MSLIAMNSRQRFLATVTHAATDRVPLFPEGLRDDVLAAWRDQGLPAGASLSDLFSYDDFEEIAPDLDPYPEFQPRSASRASIRELRRRLDPSDPRRLPADWEQCLPAWKSRPHPLFLRLHHGLFLSLGISGWRSFAEAMRLLVDEPVYVHAWMEAYGEFAARLADRILSQVQVDAVIFSEPIAGNHGPLISPHMYRSFALQHYQPVFEVLKAHQVSIVILRTYANPGVLLPVALPDYFNCLWACECPPGEMDFTRLRRLFGSSLSLIGGIDADVLRQDEAAIRQAVDALLPLVQSGGVIPLADGRLRSEVPYSRYAFYRRLLEDVISP